MGCDFVECGLGTGGSGYLAGVYGNGTPESPWTYVVEVWAPYLRILICGDFLCDNNGHQVGLAPPSVRGLSEDVFVEFALAGALYEGVGALLEPFKGLNNNPILRVGPGYNQQGQRIWRIASGGRWGKGGPKLPWHKHWP